MIPISMSAGTFSYNTAILNTTFTLIPFQLVQTVCPSVNVRGRFLEEYVCLALTVLSFLVPCCVPQIERHVLAVKCFCC